MADPGQKLLEFSTTRRCNCPLLIPDFVTSLPVVLKEDQETVLGTSGGTQKILEETPTHFSQWSPANFRITNILMKEGDLLSALDIMKFTSYSTLFLDPAKIYPIACVVQYGDIYRQMQFAIGCKWGTESQFIYQQSLHKPQLAWLNQTSPPQTK